MNRFTLCLVLLGLACGSRTNAATVLVEAESFADHGGWSLDTQFIREMGSPHLIAHGLGKPVADLASVLL